MLYFYFIFYYCPKVIVYSEKETNFFFPKLSCILVRTMLHEYQKRKFSRQKKKNLKFTWKKRYPPGSPVLTTLDFKGGSYKGLVNPIFKSLETLIFLTYIAPL